MEQSKLFMSFAGSLQQGKLHGGRAPSGTVIETMLWEVARFLDSRGLGDPRRSTLGQPFLDAQFADMIRRWKAEDPVPRPQQALKSSTIHRITMTYRNSLSLKRRVTADLVMVAYFFPLRVGEYTPTTPKKGSVKRTIPLRKWDITFWHSTHTIPTDSPVERLQQADGVTINLANQKNGAKDAKVSHSQSGDKTLCPCRSLLVRLVAELRDFPADTPIGTYQTATGTNQVSNWDILEAVRQGAIRDNLDHSRYDYSLIGTHSLSGGATRLFLEGFNKDVIRLMGRWSSDTYLKYIQPQVAQLATGASTKMVTIRRYQWVDPTNSIT
jgi:hypothetical protein